MCKGEIPLSSDFDWSCASAQSMAGLNEADLRLVRALIAAREGTGEFSILIDLYQRLI